MLTSIPASTLTQNTRLKGFHGQSGRWRTALSELRTNTKTGDFLRPVAENVLQILMEADADVTRAGFGGGRTIRAGGSDLAW